MAVSCGFYHVCIVCCVSGLLLSVRYLWHCLGMLRSSWGERGRVELFGLVLRRIL